MIFVTVGSQKFPFNRLLEAVDKCVDNGTLNDTVCAQSGVCTYKPKNYNFMPFFSRELFKDTMKNASVVITHGGTGIIIDALKKQKKVIAMARLSQYGEHVDDHQVQLLHEFEKTGLLLTCTDADSLAVAYKKIMKYDFASYISTNAKFIADLDNYLQTNI